MIIVYAECKCKPGCESQMLEAAKGMLEPTRAEKGCISYELRKWKQYLKADW